MGKVSPREAREIARESVGKYPAGKPPAVIKAVPTGLSAREKEQVSIKQPVEKITKRPKTLSEIITDHLAERDKQRTLRQREVKAAAEKMKSPFEMAPQSLATAKEMQQARERQTRQMLVDLGVLPDDTGKTEFRPKSKTVQDMVERELRAQRDKLEGKAAEELRTSANKQWEESKINPKMVQNPVNEPGTRAWIEEQVTKNLAEIRQREAEQRVSRPRVRSLGGGFPGVFGGGIPEQIR